MNEHSVSRTLVKSPPELWAEVSDPAALARHLGEFGEIAITRLEPERAVAWEGERARGTVALEPAGWGTRVTLAVVAEEEAVEEPEVAEEPEEPAAAEEPEPEPLPAPAATEEPAVEEPAVEDPAPVEDPPAPRRGFLARLFGRRGRPAAEATEPEPLAAEAGAGVQPLVVEETVVEELPAAPLAADDPAAAKEDRVEDPVEAILSATLDTLGGANHRPFSRG